MELGFVSRFMKSRESRLLALLFILSICAKLVFFPLFSGIPYFTGISADFIDVANNTVSGRGFSETITLENGTVFYQPAIWQPPGYSAFVAGAFAVTGNSLLGVEIIQILLLSLSAPLIYLLLRRISDEKTALIGASLEIIYLPIIRMSSTILSEALAGPILLLSVYFLIRRNFLVSGLLLGVSLLFRDFVIVLIPAILIYLFLIREKGWTRHLIIFLVGILIVTAPWMARNYAHYGSLAISAPKMGVSLWEGIGEFDPEGRFGAPWGDEAVIELENATSFKYPDPFGRDGIRLEKSINIILNNPLWYSGVMAKRVPQLLLMNLGFGLSENLEDGPWVLLSGYNILLPLTILIQLIVYLSALFGAWLVVRKRDKNMYIFILVPLFSLLSLAHHVEPRYFIPASYFIIPLAAYGIARMKPRIQRIFASFSPRN